MADTRLNSQFRYLVKYFYVNNFIIQFLLLIPKVDCSDDILGCGGFVKSDIEINFSLVEVKLYTKQGTLKYQTDCAPNNGYYMIPLYDKGNYIIKIHPPSGWIFEPNSMELQVDGTTDKCSKGEDINFHFKGFSIMGRIISRGQRNGPAGVVVTLKKAADGNILQQVSTTVDGNYVFPGVTPGDYVVSATHPSWTFLKSSVAIKVVKDNGNIGNQLVISGYDVKGSVFSEGEPIKGVKFLLFSKGNPVKGFQGCDVTSVPGLQVPAQHTFLCFVVSHNDGSFTFPSLPPSKYLMIPYYKGEYITFDVVPSELEFTVSNDSVKLKKVFQVQGFSVKGKILLEKGNIGIEGARILLNGKEETVTGFDGSYHLDNMKTGSYKLQANKEHMYFEVITVKITPNTPQLPNIYASSFSLCGQIIITSFPEGLPQTSQRKILIKNESVKSEEFLIDTDRSGSFCTKVKPGKYLLKPVLSKIEEKAGLRLLPTEKKVFIDHIPVLDVIFSQFRAKISGTVTCLGKCIKNLQVSLYPLGQKENMQLTEVHAQGNKGSFSFDNILPGKYQAIILKEEWCWKKNSFDFEVITSDITNLAFHQNGFLVTFSTSHAIKMNYKQANRPEVNGTFSLVHGINKFCLEHSGNYIMEPKSCHQFEENMYYFDTFTPLVISLTAIKHEVHIIVKSDAAYLMRLQIRSLILDEDPVVIEPEKVTPDNKNKTFLAEFYYWAQNGETLDITPLSQQLLFYPSSEKITVVDNCVSNLVKFDGHQGIYIGGQVHPIIAGVQVNIIADDIKRTVIHTETDEKGSYKIGPLHSHIKYKVEAEKDGFIISLVEGSPYSFKAFKLAEVIVQVIVTDKQTLSGVLLSLSGGIDYRKNSLTNENGSLTFSGLSPGQYFLRPMMKEYEFEPPSKMIDVAEGTTAEIKILGKRVAFSCYGFVTSLNGEAEPGILVEAIGQDECASKQEEGKTEQDGSYRIRGLEPNCMYEIFVKIGDINPHIERAAPKSKSIFIEDDVTNVNIIVFRYMNQMDVNGNVIASPEHLNNLKVVLYKEDNLDIPLYTISLASSSFFHFPPILLDNNKYLVRLESTLPRNSYDYKVQDYTFNASTTYLHISLEFNPKRKASDQDVSQGSYLVVPLTLVLLLLIYYYASIVPVLSKGAEFLQTIMNPRNSMDLGLQDKNRKKLKARRT